jgi:hypothetical protein
MLYMTVHDRKVSEEAQRKFAHPEEEDDAYHFDPHKPKKSGMGYAGQKRSRAGIGATPMVGAYTHGLPTESTVRQRAVSPLVSTGQRSSPKGPCSRSCHVLLLILLLINEKSEDIIMWWFCVCRVRRPVPRWGTWRCT